MAVLKNVIMQEMAALFPEELERNRQAILAAQDFLRSQQRRLLGFLRAGRVGKLALNYYDPDVNRVTDAYLTALLKYPDYDLSMAGKWCITPSISGQRPLPIKWWKEHGSFLVRDGHPYITIGNQGCFWKLIPHGHNLYTIVNTYGRPKHDYYGQYLSFDIHSDHYSQATVATDANLWEITGNNQKRYVS